MGGVRDIANASQKCFRSSSSRTSSTAAISSNSFEADQADPISLKQWAKVKFARGQSMDPDRAARQAGVADLWPALLADTGATVLVTLNALRLLG